MTAVQTAPQRYVKKPPAEIDDSIGALRTKARELKINSFGMGKPQLKAAIAAAEAASNRAPAEASAVDEFTDPHGEFDRGEAPRADDAGEALGPKGIERIPMGTHKQRLALATRPGFYRRWINDVPGRVERAKAAGYEHVRDAQGNPISRPCGTQNSGGGLRAFAMELPEHLRELDNLERRRNNDEIDEAVNRGRIGQRADDNRYIPEQGISIRRR